MPSLPTRLLVALVGLAVVGAGCATQPETDTAPGASSSSSGVPTSPPASSATSQSADATPKGKPTVDRPAPKRMVLAISVDGLNPDALASLGTGLAPNFWELISHGAATLDARTEFEQTVTLPNHTGMLTGRRIDARAGGHGYTANVDNGRRVTDLDGDPVPSVFDTVAAAGLSTALFASKEKFELFDRTWPSIDRYVSNEDNTELVDLAASDLVREHRAFTFLHLSLPDEAGHAHGWMSPQYLRAVADVDVLLGTLIDTIDRTPRLRRNLVLILTADHGGAGPGHSDAAKAADYTIPFVAYGAGVPEGVDLYAINPRRADPGSRRIGYEGTQPVRNADVANLAVSLLGLGSVAGSEVGARDPLKVLR